MLYFILLLKYQTSDNKGMTQATISKMMLVNRANITMLVDRMEKGDLVTRTAAPGDRRSNIVIMTEKGKKLLDEVEVLCGSMHTPFEGNRLCKEIPKDEIYAQ